MTRGSLLAVLVLLTRVGIADSVYLAESAMTDTALVCDISGFDGCNVVAQSPYAQLFDIPLGVYGVAFYLATLLLLIVVMYAPRRLWYKGLVVISGLGVLASLYFLAIQFFVIKATCIYCLGSAAVTFVVFPLSILLYKRFAPKLPVVVP